MAERCRAETRAPVEEEGEDNNSTRGHEPQPSKKRSFSISFVPRPKQALTIPKVTELREGKDWTARPPEKVLRLLGNDSLAVGVDIETHDWEVTRGQKGCVGQYGFFTRCNSNTLAARIVQIGWAFEDSGADTTCRQERLIRPDGFEISEKAAKYHGITHDCALRHGKPLASVLKEFMEDMVQICDRGGRVIIHHLEYDAGIIANELERAGMSEMKEKWSEMARRGLCTMDPSIGKYVRCNLGLEFAPDMHPGGNTMSLDAMVSGLIPSATPLLNKRHTAGIDAQLHVMLYRSLRELV
jgi:DNA polymerase III epsilon subunit-like protein